MENTMAGPASAGAAKECCVYPTGPKLGEAQRQFDKLVRTVLKPCERWICRDSDFEDRRQEGLGRCWEWYSRQVAGGVVPDTALVVHACSLAMKNRSRTLVGHEHRPRRDVYDVQCHGVELLRLDGILGDDERPERRQDLSLGLARLGVQDPTTNIISKLDLSRWLEGLTTTDRGMIELRGAGYGLGEISRLTGRSVTGVFRRTRQLGEELALRAGAIRPDVGGAHGPLAEMLAGTPCPA